MSRKDRWKEKEPPCCYCGRKCLNGEGWARDNDGSYHWGCIPEVDPRNVLKLGHEQANRAEGIVEELQERFDHWCREHPRVREEHHAFAWLLYQEGAAGLKDTLCGRGILSPDYS